MRNDTHRSHTPKKKNQSHDANQMPSPGLPRTPAELDQRDRERAEGEGMTAARPSGEGSPQVEGEGSYSAARRYREGLEESVRRADSKELAEEAAGALDSPEGDELRRAEREAKKGHVPHSHAQKKGH